MTTPKVKLAEPPTRSNRGKPQTLVIDDDIAVADTVAMVLKTGGFEAVACTAVQRASNLLVTCRSNSS